MDMDDCETAATRQQDKGMANDNKGKARMYKWGIARITLLRLTACNRGMARVHDGGENMITTNRG